MMKIFALVEKPRLAARLNFAVCLALASCLTIPTTSLAQNGLANPESINSDGKFLYVSNVGKALDPVGKDGDGFISKLSLDGKMITPSITTEKLNAPKGSAIIKGVLYVADVDRIVGIELATGKKVKEISLASQQIAFSNDVAAKDDSTLFVSATDLGKVFEVDIKTSAVKFVADVKGANGLAYDRANKKLYTCSFSFEDLKAGEIGVISWKDEQAAYEKLGAIQGAFDGLALVNANTLVVSDWGAMDKAAGFLLKIDLKSKTATKLDGEIMMGPADFYYDGKRAVIPAMPAQQIIFRSIK